jgi:hypothetical protein
MLRTGLPHGRRSVAASPPGQVHVLGRPRARLSLAPSAEYVLGIARLTLVGGRLATEQAAAAASP